jgi:hypothetical protein
MRFRLRTLLAASKWLRFSLRSIYILLTIFGLWLGFEVNWLRQRREARRWIELHEVSGGWSRRNPKDVRLDSGIGPVRYGQAVAAPWSLRKFSEPSLAYIHLDKNKLSEADIPKIDSLQSLFPEANGVFVNDEPGWVHRWQPGDSHGYMNHLRGTDK